jgi:tryptophanase
MRSERRLCGCQTRGTYSDHWAVKGQISVIKTGQLILNGEIIAVCSEINTKHINSLCGQNVDFVNVQLVVHIVTTGL